MGNLLIVFIDGLGVGEKSIKNPLYKDSYSVLKYLNIENVNKLNNRGIFFKGLDSNIGLKGLPQSATCQTALFTGFKLYNIMEFHQPGLPNKSLISIIYRTNLLQRLESIGLSVDFINAYHESYFERRFNRLSLTTHLVLSLRKPKFHFLEDIKSGCAVFADITNEHLINEGYNIELFTPERASEILLEQLKNYNIVLYEIPFLDRLAHKKRIKELDEKLQILDRLLFSLVDNISSYDSLIVVSDHGNVEDLTSGKHTSNDAILFLKGSFSSEIFEKTNTLYDFSEAIINCFL